MIINNKWQSLLAVVVSLFFLVNLPECLARSHPGGGGGGSHPHAGGGGGHPHFGGGGGHFSLGGDHPHISATSFHPAVVHHVFHTSAIFHTTVHHTAVAGATVARVALHHTAVAGAAVAGVALHHTAATVRNNAALPSFTAHPNLVMNPHPGVPRSAYNNFNRYGGGHYGSGNGYGNGYGHGFGSLFEFPLFFAYPDIYPFYYPYDDNDYPDIYDYFYAPQPYSEASQPASPSTQTNEQWVAAQNGDVPADAVVNTTENNVSTYYCRSEFNGKMYYGVLVKGDACYTQVQAVSLRFTSYEVMVQ